MINKGMIVLVWMVLLIGVTFGQPTTQPAERKTPRVLFLLDDGFNKTEFYEIYLPLIALGYPVDIAAPKKGVVYLHPDGKPDQKGGDTQANLSLDDVKSVKPYAALVIPGGYSPGKLEKYPKALQICKMFFDADKPVAAICHGPRLLLRARLLDDKVFTCLFNVPDELSDQWKAGERGAYVDQSVVQDGNLITGRYPGDTASLAEALIGRLGRLGGPSICPGRPAVLILSPAIENSHIRWAIRNGLTTAGLDVQLIDSAQQWQKKVATGDWVPDYSQVIVTVNQGWFDQGDTRRLIERFKTNQKPVLAIQVKDVQSIAMTPMIYQAVDQSGAGMTSIGSLEPPTAVIAIRQGFDGQVVAAMRAYLDATGRKVAVVGPRVGWMQGINGMPVHVDATYDVQLPPGKEIIIVAPGGFWPKQANARQATQPEWVTKDQAAFDAKRHAWLMKQMDSDAKLIVFGTDTLLLAKDKQFKGKKFAGSPQTRWEYPRKTGAGFSPTPIVTVSPRLITVSGPDALGPLMRQLGMPGEDQKEQRQDPNGATQPATKKE